MIVNLPKPGRYVVAVSGGVDSICLLHMLVELQNYDLIIAHFDHGIRSDSKQDKEFVEQLAKSRQLKFVSGCGKLGRNASEARARQARYDFLYAVREQEKAQAILTAHHLDDRLETLIINLIRGTGRLGLGSIRDTEIIKRPLLKTSKLDVRAYAKQHNLSWRDDSTNQDSRYLRNYIRLRILPRIDQADKHRFVELMDRQVDINDQIDQLIKPWFSTQEPDRISRRLINVLSYNESKELIAAWLRYNNLVNFDHKTIERLTLGAKTKRPGTKIDVYDGNQVNLSQEYLTLDILEC
jgi:tRNA(Ile)-lysidine synthase